MFCLNSSSSASDGNISRQEAQLRRESFAEKIERGRSARKTGNRILKSEACSPVSRPRSYPYPPPHPYPRPYPHPRPHPHPYPYPHPHPHPHLNVISIGFRVRALKFFLKKKTKYEATCEIWEKLLSY